LTDATRINKGHSIIQVLSDDNPSRVARTGSHLTIQSFNVSFDMRIASQGAVAHATDRSQGRLLRLKESAQRLGFDVAVSQVDWILKPEIDGPDMDAVLVDAPCTGLGTLRRHPEIRWRTMPTDPAAMALEQLEILTNASKRVRVGGRVVYSVCSPEPEEGAELVAQFLIENPNFTVEADILSAPQRFHEDAFYGARIRRNS
jgi:16S rRNA (cytosine967-C5)-methyltransferase